MAYELEFLDAVKRGDAAVVAAALHDRPGLVLFAGDYDKTGLHWAAELGHATVARMLLDAGADIEARTSWGATPLDWAATMGSRDVAELLLASGASGYSLIVAAALGALPDVKSFLDSGADNAAPAAAPRRGVPDVPNEFWPADSAYLRGDVISDAMYAAARNGHVDVVEYLLDRGAVVDAKGVFGATALHWAAINGHQRTVDVLLAHGADLTIRDARFDGNPEEWAAEGGFTEMATVLRQHRQSI